MTTAVDRGRTTPWAAGRLDGRTGPPQLLFGRMFEDPAIEDGLFPPAGRVLCIASAGDTARALAASGRSVLAVDTNPAQIDEVRRRLAGHRPRAGVADRLLVAGRAALVPLGWRRSRLARFCNLRDGAAQAREWHSLASPAVRLALRAALSRSALRLAYGEAFARLAPPRFGEALLDRIGARLGVGPNAENPWLTHLLTGTWTGDDPVTGVEHITLHHGDVADVLACLPPASLDGISLSNILDGPGRAYQARLLAAANRAARPGSAIVIRSFLDLNVLGDPDARRRADGDRSLLWGTIAVRRAQGATP